MDRSFVIVSGIITLASSIANVALMITFWMSSDVVWASSLLLFIGMSTIFNIIITALDHPSVPGCLLWTPLSLLQLKAWGDTLEYFTHPTLRHGEVSNPEYKHSFKIFRTKRFFSSVVQSLPVSFVLTYILMLDLHNRINEHILGAILLLSFLSFSFGTTHFVAGKDTVFTGVIAFLHILAQFVFRLLAVCSVCVRFREWGVFAIFLSWLFVYLFGPKGTYLKWAEICGCVKKVQPADSTNGLPPLSNLCIVFTRVFLTPLTFFIVVDVLYENPDDPEQDVKAYDCFKHTLFVLWRMLENAILVLCFMFIPHNGKERGEDEYEKWLSHPTSVGVISLIALLVALSTWQLLVTPPEPVRSYQKQFDAI